MEPDPDGDIWYDVPPTELPDEIWYRILGFLMPTQFTQLGIHIRGRVENETKFRNSVCFDMTHPTPATSLYPLYLSSIRDIGSFSKTCKHARLMSNEIFYKRLHLCFDDVKVFKRFADSQARVVVRNELVRRFRGIDLVFRDVNNSTIKTLWSIGPLPKTEYLRVYLLRQRERLSNEEAIENAIKALDITNIEVDIQGGDETSIGHGHVDPALQFEKDVFTVWHAPLYGRMNEYDSRTIRGVEMELDKLRSQIETRQVQKMPHSWPHYSCVDE
ncbi:hypothetical protein AU210_016452 [Fusarium oxysporum f. sp. radicis-cucumerinum]|uniref:Uncharacterized protein n=1 Tax=Fusarium oxysporum f. sp. radicis-cucumerinum TaxID=327505 RepID=A0A2H3FT49_FUSOX|nr:hypothetical protein AU210_016452 [Fusarium oxysporum f. sp. radicis-cucumerinum]